MEPWSSVVASAARSASPFSGRPTAVGSCSLSRFRQASRAPCFMPRRSFTEAPVTVYGRRRGNATGGISVPPVVRPSFGRSGDETEVQSRRASTPPTGSGPPMNSGPSAANRLPPIPRSRAAIPQRDRDRTAVRAVAPARNSWRRENRPCRILRVLSGAEPCLRVWQMHTHCGSRSHETVFPSSGSSAELPGLSPFALQSRMSLFLPGFPPSLRTYQAAPILRVTLLVWPSWPARRAQYRLRQFLS